MTIRSIHGEPGMVFVGYDTDGECLWDYPYGDNMAKPLDEDFMTGNFNTAVKVNFTDLTGAASSITTGGISLVSTEPKQAKGGVYAPADVKLIKDALAHYARLDISDAEQRQIANLMHRLNNRI